MSQQVGRAHFANELSIELPAAVIEKDSVSMKILSAFRNKDGVRRAGRRLVLFSYWRGGASTIEDAEQEVGFTASAIVEKFLQLRFIFSKTLGSCPRALFFSCGSLLKIEKGVAWEQESVGEQFVHLIILGLLRVMSLQFPVADGSRNCFHGHCLVLDQMGASFGAFLSKQSIHDVQAVQAGILGNATDK